MVRQRLDFSYAILISVIFTGLIFLLNIFVINSTFNGYDRNFPGINTERLASGFYLHTSHPVFAMRPLTNLAVDSLNRFLNVPIAYGLIAVFASFIILDGILVYLCARIFLNSKLAWLSIIGFYLTFNILFIFGSNMHTYDEPIQYVFLLSSLIFLFRKKYIFFTLALLLATITRETSLFLIPTFLLVAYFHSSINFRKVLISLLVVIGIYFIYYWVFSNITGKLGGSIKYLEQERFLEWRYNIKDWQYTKESIIGITLVLLPSIIIFYNFIKKAKLSLSESEKYLWYAFLGAIIINTPIAFFTARAQEARIFALPLLFFWPLSGKIILYYINFFRDKLKIIFLKRKIFKLSLFLLAIAWLSFTFFDPTFTDFQSRYFYQMYMFITYLSLIIFI
ncbi:MAG: hypothetical protein WA057_00655 [Candidatus Magasanikiibacteriota bacterium]